MGLDIQMGLLNRPSTIDLQAISGWKQNIRHIAVLVLKTFSIPSQGICITIGIIWYSKENFSLQTIFSNFIVLCWISAGKEKKKKKEHKNPLKRKWRSQRWSESLKHELIFLSSWKFPLCLENKAEWLLTECRVAELLYRGGAFQWKESRDFIG